MNILPIRTVGIIGLGDQGTPIGQRILANHWSLAFYARRADVRERFTALGARSLDQRMLAACSDLLLVVVVDDMQVRQVIIEDGMLAAMRPGSVVAIHSTVRPETCRDMATAAATRGVHVLDVPVSGGRDRSYDGDLTLFVGGAADALAAVRPVFESYGSLIVHMGDVGTGQATKLLNNYFYAAHLGTASKAVELIRGLGIDQDAAAAALPRGSGASAVLAMQAARRFERTRHDKGMNHALTILTEAVQELRAMAQQANIPLGIVDQLVDKALEDEALRAAADAGQT